MSFTFIDLFAGIGGFRIAMEALGGKCVFSAEIDKFACKTYIANHGDDPFNDITDIAVKQSIPDFDILCAGFPCQAFSQAGKRLGFNDTRGTLFFDVADVIRLKKPKAFFLENVKGLLTHDKGNTIKTILNTLRDDLGYYVPEPQLINARNFGVPQNRERVFIIGFRTPVDFTYPLPTNSTVTFGSIKEHTNTEKYILSDRYIKCLEAHKQRHAAKGNGFGYRVVQDNDVTDTLLASNGGRDRNLVVDDATHKLRHFTPRECARLQGFPETFKIVVSDTQAYKQFGNTVSIPAVQETAKKMLHSLNSHGIL